MFLGKISQINSMKDACVRVFFQFDNILDQNCER